MRKGFMFIDENIKLDFPMVNPEFKEYIDGMDKAFDEGNQVKFDYYWEAIGAFAKNEYHVGNITSEQMHAVWERYGTGG